MITNEILESIDEVSNVTLESMIGVYTSLCAEYEKSAVIMEECSGDISGYAIFQEGAVSDEVKKLGEGQNTFVRILTLIPRIIMALFKVIKNKLSKSIEKADKESKRLGKTLSKMTEDAKQKLFGKTDKGTKTKAIMAATGLSIIGAVIGGKKIHEKIDEKNWKNKTGKYAPEKIKEKTDKLVEDSLKNSKIVDKDGNPVDMTNEENKEKLKNHIDEKNKGETKAAEKPAEEKKEPEVPANINKVIEAFDDLDKFYKKYEEVGSKYNTPISYKNGQIYIEEGVSKTVDKIISTLNDFDKIMNGGNPKKLGVKYNDNNTLDDLITEDTFEKCVSRINKATKDLESNSARQKEIESKIKEFSDKYGAMSKEEKKNLNNKENSKYILIAKIGGRLGVLQDIININIQKWTNVIAVIKTVNDCFEVSDTKDDSYKINTDEADKK